MNVWSSPSESTAAALVGRWTILLALAWIGHRALAGSNPRWRVALWRASAIGVIVVGVLGLAPPMWTIPIAPAPVTARVVPPEMRPAPRQVEIVGPAIIVPEVQPGDRGTTAGTMPASPARTATGTWSAGSVLLALWAFGVAMLAARMTLAWVGLGRIIGRAEEAPARTVELGREVAAGLDAPRVRVVVSTEVATPCLAGLLRPVVLLPAVTLTDDDLKAVLAHELAHARGGDLAWNLLAHVASAGLWFHPLAWRLRQVHASACDAVCDAVAADYLGDVPAYARTLARVALSALKPPPSPGLAMARSSEVRRRIDSLRREVFRSPLPRKLALPAIGAAALLSIVIGGLALSDAGPPPQDRPAAGPEEARPAAPADEDRFEIRAVEAATGKPIEGATVTWQLRTNGGKYRKTEAKTGADGHAALGWAKGATVNGLSVKVKKAGFVPYLIRWDDTNHPLAPPATKELRLVTGVAIGGLVKDESGQPVVGAEIMVNAPPNEAEGSGYSVDIAETRTDAQGRWKVDDAPADLNRVSVLAQALGFIREGGTPSRDLDRVITLKRGFTVKGRVIDPQGNPIADANVSGGDSFGSQMKPTKTDAGGAFSLENFPPGASLVTVMAKGFAPDLREIHPEDQPELEFRLGPGHLLRGRVVDRRGQPVAGAMVAANGWREHRSLDFRVDTDKDGQFEWRDAPGDVVRYSIGKSGFMYRRDTPLPRSGEEQVITLDPELVISGRVTDAATGQPVARFRVVPGLSFSDGSRVTWLEQDGIEFGAGQYNVKQSEPYAGYAYRVDADGYRSIESRPFKPGEGQTSFDFALARSEPADRLSGVVLGPDGRSAAGAEVALATPEHPLLFDRGTRFSRSNGMTFATAGPDGRFSFRRPAGPYLLAAMSDDGYAEAAPAEVAKSATLAMKAWGKIQGEARIGRQPAANQPITLLRRGDSPTIPGQVHIFYSTETETDAQGRFAFDRAIPVASEVARVIITDFGNGSRQHMGCWQEPVDVAPGRTVAVRVGGKGRPVIGRVAVQAPPGAHVDWRQNRPATIEKVRSFNPLSNLLGPDPRQNDRFAGSFDKDGRFRVEDVPPGRYELTVTIDAPPVQGKPGPTEEIGRIRVPIDVPEGDGLSPVDLGEIEGVARGR